MLESKKQMCYGNRLEKGWLKGIKDMDLGRRKTVDEYDTLAGTKQEIYIPCSTASPTCAEIKRRRARIVQPANQAAMLKCGLKSWVDALSRSASPYGRT